MASYSNLLSGGGLGGSFAGFGGDLLSSQLGFQPNMLGSVGGMLGSSILGSSFGPLGGFAGSFAGSLLGNAVGGVLGIGGKKPSRPRVSLAYDFASGDPSVTHKKMYEGDSLDLFSRLTDQIGDTASAVFKRLGIDSPVDRFNFGTFQGRAGFTLPDDPYMQRPPQMSQQEAFSLLGGKPINFDPLSANFSIDVLGGKPISHFQAAPIQQSPKTFARDPSLVYGAIGPGQPDVVAAAQKLGRVFGDLGDRTSVPSQEVLTQAAQAALGELLSKGISKAGLTEDDVRKRLLGEPAALPNLVGSSFGGLLGGPQIPSGELLGPTRPFWDVGGVPAPFWQMGGVPAPFWRLA